jgi:hypothetical protein
MDSTGLFVILASFVLTFFVGRLIGKRLQARREARQAAEAERMLAQQSRQVRRAQSRKKRG